jgi:membrane-associated phospholipid phosphatase
MAAAMSTPTPPGNPAASNPGMPAMAQGTDRPPATVGDALASGVEARRGPGSPWARALRELGAMDRAVYRALARTPTAGLDGPVRRLSRAADHSRLWLAIAAAVALLGGGRGRRAALEGVVSIGVASATVNLGLKRVHRRRRPDRVDGLSPARHVTMPASTSFPSGHAASAFAFAHAAGRNLPGLAVPLRLLAAAVAYSRVHTGVHYPGDVVVGSIVGAGTAALVAAAFDSRFARSRACVSGPAFQVGSARLKARGPLT